MNTTNRYEIQTRAGAEWSMYAAAPNAAGVAKYLRETRGRTARVIDRRTGERVHVGYDRAGAACIVTVPA